MLMQAPHFRVTVVGRFLFAMLTMSWRHMLKSMLSGVFVVALVCWAIGAYNRLVRLRAKTVQALAALQSLRLQLDRELTEPAYAEQTIANRLKIETECQVQNGVYDVAVTQYNEAIVQTPASWLATLFAFKPIKKEVDEH